MAYTIDKNIPIPARHPNFIPESLPIPALEVNDSIFFPLAEGKTPKQHVSNVQSRAVNWKKRSGWKFTCRSVEGGVRVWRIA